MTSKANLSNWNFLIGEFEGEATEDTGEGKIITTAKFDYYPSNQFIRGTFESNNEEGLVNRGEYFLYIDPYKDKFLRKVVFSYGFVNNEISYYFDETTIKFETLVEPSPKQFEGITWRSFMHKISNNEIEFGLENSQNGKDFKLYNKTKLRKINN